METPVDIRLMWSIISAENLEPTSNYGK